MSDGILIDIAFMVLTLCDVIVFIVFFVVGCVIIGSVIGTVMANRNERQEQQLRSYKLMEDRDGE